MGQHHRGRGERSHPQPPVLLSFSQADHVEGDAEERHREQIDREDARNDFPNPFGLAAAEDVGEADHEEQGNDQVPEQGRLAAPGLEQVGPGKRQQTARPLHKSSRCSDDDFPTRSR